MYVVTFYSFKGGVGRTLALANVGLELARTGRQVMLIDFDLESPGIDTFDALRAREPHPGMVEYVSEFMATRIAPDARDFIYEVLGVGQKGGHLWVMPSGKRDEQFAQKLSHINWERLYQECDGFLMFEDLKAQWIKSFKPDYVLIDSRTGHTDIEGICTRQLPDAVVVLFFPNEQNLAGLKTTVSFIRAEQESRKEKPIKLHYVMSNVPDLDDEQEILAGLQQRFQQELGYEELTAVIHRYDSLSLLKQSLFVLERPRSRLSKEYLVLLNRITDENMQDREAVMRSLTSREWHMMRPGLAKESQQKRMDDILKYHSHDGEVLYVLAMDLKRRGRLEDSKMLLARSIDLGYRSAQALLAQAEIRLQGRNMSAALIDVFEAFQSEDLEEDELTRGIEILRLAGPEKLLEIAKTPAFRLLGFHRSSLIAYDMMWCKEGLQAAIDLLSGYREDSSLSVGTAQHIRLSLSLSLVGLSRFDDALRLFGNLRPSPQDLDTGDSFNYGMAEWGKTGTPPKDMFKRVVDLDSKSDDGHDANYHQCLAVALWVIEKKRDALARIKRAEDQVVERSTPVFSCWRYMMVTPSDFQKDCRLIRDLIEGRKVYPKFFPDRKDQ
jgi:MinD-like ATPase involved in chromosome partitioning or flagellar assembly